MSCSRDPRQAVNHSRPNKPKRLGKIVWTIADALRGSMNADDFRNSMLSFVFLRYLSNNCEAAAKKELGSDYPKGKIDEAEGREENAARHLVRADEEGRCGLCPAPTISELCQFAAMARRGNRASRIAIASAAQPSLRMPR